MFQIENITSNMYNKKKIKSNSKAAKWTKIAYASTALANESDGAYGHKNIIYIGREGEQIRMRIFIIYYMYTCTYAFAFILQIA